VTIGDRLSYTAVILFMIFVAVLIALGLSALGKAVFFDDDTCLRKHDQVVRDYGGAETIRTVCDEYRSTKR